MPPNIKLLFDDVSKFEMPHHISFQGDETCNLSCPSCRTRIKKTPPEQQQAQRQAQEAAQRQQEAQQRAQQGRRIAGF